ncbi:hypothetical protein Tco_1164306 [Tanacetum coccineum]
MEEPVDIVEREIKRLKRSQIPLVKVRWNSRRGPEFTWEREDSFKQKYPQLFTNRASSSTTSNALGYSIFCCDPDLGVLQIGIRAKVIENQSCLLHRPLLPTGTGYSLKDKNKAKPDKTEHGFGKSAKN